MTTRHLVTRLDTALDRQINLNNLQNPRGKVVALGEFLAFVFEALVQNNLPFPKLLFGSFQLLVQIILGHTQLKPVVFRQLGQIVHRDFLTLLQLQSTGDGFT